jgi:uncharacterized protein YqhQ
MSSAAAAARRAPKRAEPFFYGGQAVIEGVLMRGPRDWACAVRRRDGSITLIEEPLKSKLYTSRVWSLPFLRGVQGLIEMLHLGTRAIQWSARVQAGDQGIELSPRAMRGSMAGSIVVALGIFVALPLILAGVLHRGQTGLLFGVIEGVARAAILVAYLALIATLPPIRRLFQYHGAEHKTINCFEAGAPVNVENVRRASTLHPRCGTGFIVVVAFVGFIVFVPLAVLPWPLLIASRLVLIPVIAAIAYEGIRLLTRFRRTPLGRLLLVPVLATQRLTTREPDDSQMEVAIAALSAVRAKGGEPTGLLSLAG